MISPSLLHSLAIVLPLGASAFPQGHSLKARQTVPPPESIDWTNLTAAEPRNTNGLGSALVDQSVFAGSKQVNVTVYPINQTEWESYWAANAKNSTFLNAPGGVLDTTSTVGGPYDPPLPDPYDPSRGRGGSGGYDPYDPSRGGSGGYDPYDPNRGRGGSGGYDPYDPSRGGSGGYDPYDPSGQGGGGYDPYDPSGGGSDPYSPGGGGYPPSTRFYLQYSVGGRSGLLFIIQGDTKTKECTVEVWALGHFKVVSGGGNLKDGLTVSLDSWVSKGTTNLKIQDNKPVCRDELHIAVDAQVRLYLNHWAHLSVTPRKIGDIPYARGIACERRNAQQPSQNGQLQQDAQVQQNATEPPVAPATGNTATS